MLPTAQDLERARTAAEVQAFIHQCSRHVADVRAMQQAAHTILELKQAEEYSKEVAARPADFPRPQGIKGA